MVEDSYNLIIWLNGESVVTLGYIKFFFHEHTKNSESRNKYTDKMNNELKCQRQDFLLLTMIIKEAVLKCAVPC